MVVRLARFADRWQWVVVSVYGPASPPFREELLADILEVVETFPGVPLLYDEDFNVTLEATNCPHDFGGRDPRSEQFWACMTEADCRRLARQIVFTHGVARHVHIHSLVWIDS